MLPSVPAGGGARSGRLPVLAALFALFGAADAWSALCDLRGPAPAVAAASSLQWAAPARRGASSAARAGVLMQMRGRRRMRREPPKVDTTPINEAIKHETVRVIVDAGRGDDDLLGVMSLEEALAAARDRELDLVLIAEKSDPPVCKIVSYDKYRFTKEKKKKEQMKAASKGKSELKELKMSYKIGQHDYDVRRKQAVRFLESGDKVKFSMLFKGREVSHSEVGKEVMLRMASELDEIGVVDSPPAVNGRQMIMMINPKPKLKGQEAKGGESK